MSNVHELATVYVKAQVPFVRPRAHCIQIMLENGAVCYCFYLGPELCVVRKHPQLIFNPVREVIDIEKEEKRSIHTALEQLHSKQPATAKMLL